MGTYVYALNTKVRTVGAVTVGVAEYRYKDNWGATQAVHNRTCGRRISHFDAVGLPDFFVMGKLEDGTAVFSFKTKDREPRDVGACFSDGINFNRVGYVRKIGRGYTIQFDAPYKE